MTQDSIVRAITGKLGSGKTFYAVMKAMEALARGEVVVSNVKFNWPAVELYLKRMGVEAVRENYRFVDTDALEANPDLLLELLPTTGAMLLLDEVHLFMNARKWEANSKKGGNFLTFLTQARKLQVDCWLISQSESNMDAQLVRMATHIIRVTNWLHVPLLGAIAPLKLTIAKICASDGRTVLGRDYIWRSGKIGNLYNTRQTFCDIALHGAAGRKVKGAIKRQRSYGWTLLTIGGVGLVLDRWMQSSRPEAEPLPAAAAVGERPAGKPGDRARGEAENRESVVASLAEMAAIEAQLPAYYRVTPWGIALVNGGFVTVGHFFVAGLVTGWTEERGGTVVLFLTSPEVPSVRIFRYDRLNIPRYNFAGRVHRGSVRGGGGAVALDGPGDLVNHAGGVTPAVEAAMGVHGEVGSEGTAGGYKYPAAVVIPSTLPSVWLGPKLEDTRK